MALWDQADFFALPLLDGGTGIGQIVAVDNCPPAAAFCALSLRRGNGAGVPAPLTLDEVVALLLIGTAHLDDGTWPILGFDTLPPTERLRGFSDVKAGLLLVDDPSSAVTDPAIAEAFVNACHGLLPWDYFPDRGLFDRMLARPNQRPPGVTVSRPAP